MKNVLFITGTSGSGKSYLTNQLLEKEGFYKLPQYTTRAKRENEGDEYFYITQQHFDIISDELMAITTVNDNWYGTIPTFRDNDEDIAIVIVNALGLKNGLIYVSRNVTTSRLGHINAKVLYLKGGTFEERKEVRDVDQERENIETFLNTIRLAKRDVEIVEKINSVENPLSVEELEQEIKNLFK